MKVRSAFHQIWFRSANWVGLGTGRRSGSYILSYEPSRGFVIPSFAMYDGSSDPYDNMLHFNKAMILNAGNDRLL